MENRKSKLLQLIDEKLSEAKTNKNRKRTQSPSTRAEVNRTNARKSTGPKTAEGKAKTSANALKHGYFANTAAPQPQDSSIFQATYHDLRMGLRPDGPVEEYLIRELAMFSARLQRLEAAEYALISTDIESNPIDPIMGDAVPHLDGNQIAAAFEQNAAALDQLHKAEVHLRRAYNRTWDRLERMQKERHKLPLDEAQKQSQRWLTYCREKANIAQPTPSVETEKASENQSTSRALSNDSPNMQVSSLVDEQEVSASTGPAMQPRTSQESSVFQAVV